MAATPLPTQTFDTASTNGELRLVLPEYLRLLDCARHFAHHPEPRPTDTATAGRFLAAAERMEPSIRHLLCPVPAPQLVGRRGLTFGIGHRSEEVADHPATTAKDLSGRLERRLAVAAEIERYLRLLARTERLATHTAPISTDPETAQCQLSAARMAEARVSSVFAEFGE